MTSTIFEASFTKFYKVLAPHASPTAVRCMTMVQKKKKKLQTCASLVSADLPYLVDAVRLAVGRVVWLVAHGALRVAEVLALVHGQAAGAATEAVTLGTKLAAVALLAEKLAAMLAGVGAVQPLVAETADEAGLVPLGASCQHLLSGIHRLAALGALGLLDGLERHDDLGRQKMKSGIVTTVQFCAI